jgi:hypothetical protein
VHVPFSDNQDYEIAWFFNENRQVEYTRIYEVPGCSRGFRAIEAPLIERGVLRRVRIGRADCQLLDMSEFVAATLDVLAQHPTLLLCETSNCIICPKRRKHMRKRAGAQETSR